MKIIGITIKQDKNGKDYRAVALSDDKKFNIFQSHTRYNEMVVGLDLNDSDLIKDGKYWNLDDEAKPTSKPSWKPKDAGIKEAMQRKETSINQFADKKEGVIRETSANRDASLFTTALIPFLYKDLSEEELKVKWQEWRKWLLEAGSIPF